MSRGLATLPNAVTLVRVAAIPFVLNALSAGNDTALAAWVAVMALSDFLDGFLARLLRSQSDVGKVLDPAADKVCVFFLAAAIWVQRGFPTWALALLVGKDVLIAAGGLLLNRKAKVPITPNFWGKAALAVELWAFVTYAFRLDWMKTDTLAVLAFFVVVSALVYAKVFWDVVRGRKTVPEIVAGYSAYGFSRERTRRARLTNAFILFLCGALLARFVWLILTPP
ncbi:MAG: CDP-alcohol phosphatidyltransferase family protein [Acidobacteria bacterium]|nr:CDP-alcohol phosphatidyltransferase family protein [Acidobacteriota bacterium]